MTRQHKQLIERCQELDALALNIAYNAEFKPALENITWHFVDALIAKLSDDVKEAQRIIGLQMHFDEATI